MPYFDHVFGNEAADGRCDVELYQRSTDTFKRCNAERNSVLHDPTHPEDGTPTHWCSALDEAYDCTHLEGFE